MDIIAAIPDECEELADNDDGDAFHHLIDLHPDATDQELIGLYRRYETETFRLLEDPSVWVKIERVAAALEKKGKISAALAHRLAGFPPPRLGPPPD